MPIRRSCSGSTKPPSAWRHAPVERNREKAGKFIADQGSAWDDRHMVEQIELNIGKDLQYIRINGALVGALVGLLLFGLNRLLTG